MSAPRLAVVGSINLDLVARTDRLPRPGETITATALSRGPEARGPIRPLGQPASGRW